MSDPGHSSDEGRGELGVGIVGTGDISTIYLQNLPSFAGVRLVACAGRRAEATQAQTAAFGIEALTFDEMLKREDIDVVVNLTPPNAHAGISLAALTAGKHVYSEKPLATDAADGRRLVTEAAARNLALGCAPDSFLGAGGRLARALVDEGRVGTILSGACTLMSHGMEHWHPNPGFFFKPGGGPVLDLGPYYLTALVNILGPVDCVQAKASTGFGERIVTSAGPRHGERIRVETPTTVMAILSFRSGAVVSLTMSWDVWRHDHPPIELYGSEGSLKVPDPNTFGGEVASTQFAGDWQAVVCDAMPFGRPNWRSPAWPASRPMIANYRGLGVAELASAVIEGTPHRSSGRLASHVLDVIEAILMAGADGTTIAVASSIERPAAMSDAEALSLLRPGGRGGKMP